TTGQTQLRCELSLEGIQLELSRFDSVYGADAKGGELVRNRVEIPRNSVVFIAW
ncbi:MAG: hypothetical protein EZS28_038640, partial [Streblomastix strix]